jgi:hypothetical protein
VELLAQAVRGAPELSDWARWLVNSPNRAAWETIQFLERAFAHLTPIAQRRARRRLSKADSRNVDALPYELLVFEVCRRFGLRPEFEPSSGEQTPDLRLFVANQPYFADVFLTNRPAKTLINFQGFDGYEDSGEAAKKIADTLAEKAARYRRLDAPLLLFVASVGHDVGMHDLETALYGTTIGELSCAGGLRVDCHKDWHPHGLFCPPGRNARHRHVSAVIGCDWFDSSARTGRRLQCVVYHHWHPDVALPMHTFGQFQDVHFLANASGQFAPAVTGTPNLVMSTTSDPEVNWGPYSTDRPW